jgi:hypothetical protein
LDAIGGVSRFCGRLIFFVFFRASSVAPHISWLTSSNVRKVPKMATFFFFFFFFYDY